MPPKKSKPFSSRFASSDEEEAQEEIADSQAPKKAPRRKTKASTGRDAVKQTAKAPPPPDDDDDDEEEEEEAAAEESSPEEEAQKPAAPRRGRGGGRGRGSRAAATGAARGGKSGSASKTAAKTKEKPTSKAKAGTSKGAGKVFVEEDDGDRDSDTNLPDADADEDDNDEAEEGLGDDGVVDDTIDETAPKEAPAAAIKTKSKSGPHSNKHAKPSKVDPEETEPPEESSLKLRDMNAEFEKLSIKYNKLLALRSTEAESALSGFKENMKQKDIASEKLIAALTSEVNAASELSAKSREIQNEAKRTATLLQEKEKQLISQKTVCERLQRENEHLMAKLSSGRAQGPGGNSGRGVPPPSTFRELSSLKEELYGDLSGLIIRRIQDDNEGLIVYDCLQTGRNGTLRFKLSVSSAALSNRSDGYNSADSEITFKPLLDPQDKLLEKVLPNYLKEEITFPREKASSFYLRLANALQNAQVSS